MGGGIKRKRDRGLSNRFLQHAGGRRGIARNKLYAYRNRIVARMMETNQFSDDRSGARLALRARLARIDRALIRLGME